MANTGSHQVSPLAPAGFPELPPVAGVRLAAAETGIRYKNRPDVLLAVLDAGTTVAGCFTRSKSRSAPVDWCVDSLEGGSARAVVINAGNANAFTGKAGVATVTAVAKSAAKLLGCKPHEIFQASTGVIGEPLDPSFITNALPKLAQSADPNLWAMAAKAIMTTDTFPKGASAVVEGVGGPIHIAGIAKGSGMIAPDMATMLVYLFTDATIPAPRLQKMLSRYVDESFNSITVDSDTSTSDTLLLCATGRSAAEPVTGDVAKAFEAALRAVMLDLARQVVRDGEGATKLVEVRVTGAASDEDAAKVAFAIANSPLVKTAVAGEDPNWGRIVAAIGKSGAEADRDRLTIRFGDILVAEKGWRAPSYREEDGAAYMKEPELVIAVDMGLRDAKRTVWTCDLTARYVAINADYRS